MITYLGVILGFITTAWIMPKYLAEDEIGLLRVIVSYSTLLAQFAGLGFSIVAVRMFPYFRDPGTHHHGFLALFFLISIIGFLVVMPVFYLYQHFFMSTDFEKTPLLNDYFYWVTPITIFILIYNIADSYYKAILNSIIGTVQKEVIQRVLILVVLILFTIRFLNFRELVFFYALAFGFPPIWMFYKLWKENELHIKPDFKFLNPGLKKQMISVAFFGMITSFSGILVLNLDIIMIERFLTLTDVGIYTITFFFGTLILVPSRPVTRISSIILAESFKKNDIHDIELIYKKSSINLTIIGVWVYLGLLVNMENIMSLIGESYRPGLMVIVFIGLANVVEMTTGVANQIIFSSSHYKYSSHFIVLLTILIIITNVIFIPIWGLMGAAFAALVSKFIYHSIKIAFLKFKMGLYPYKLATLLPFIIAALIYYLQSYLPKVGSFYTDIIIRSLLVSVLFIIPVLYFNISSDANQWILSLFKAPFLKNLRRKNR
jgi:O-antigen/teichoic acid export membrane protein